MNRSNNKIMWIILIFLLLRVLVWIAQNQDRFKKERGTGQKMEMEQKSKQER